MPVLFLYRRVCTLPVFMASAAAIAADCANTINTGFLTDGTIGNMTGGETNGNEQVLTFFFLWDDGTIGYGVGEPTADFYISFIFLLCTYHLFLRVTVGSCVSPWYMQPYRYHR